MSEPGGESPIVGATPVQEDDPRPSGPSADRLDPSPTRPDQTVRDGLSLDPRQSTHGRRPRRWPYRGDRSTVPSDQAEPAVVARRTMLLGASAAVLAACSATPGTDGPRGAGSPSPSKTPTHRDSTDAHWRQLQRNVTGQLWLPGSSGYDVATGEEPVLRRQPAARSSARLIAVDVRRSRPRLGQSGEFVQIGDDMRRSVDRAERSPSFSHYEHCLQARCRSSRDVPVVSRDQRR
jgi:hypothetical protein